MSSTELSLRDAECEPADDATALACMDDSSSSALGSQVVLDLYECQTDHLDDLDWVKQTLVNAARAAGATVVETVFHKFAPFGISGVVVLAESHVAIHIWPENRYAAIDVFTCGKKVRIDVARVFLEGKFQAKRVLQRSFKRGEQALTDRTA